MRERFLAGLGLVAVLGTSACKQEVEQPTPLHTQVALAVSCDPLIGRQSYRGTVTLMLAHNGLPQNEQIYTVVKISNNEIENHSKRIVILNRRGVFLKNPGFIQGPMENDRIGVFKSSVGDVVAFQGEKDLSEYVQEKPVSKVHLDPLLCPQNA